MYRFRYFSASSYCFSSAYFRPRAAIRAGASPTFSRQAGDLALDLIPGGPDQDAHRVGRIGADVQQDAAEMVPGGRPSAGAARRCRRSRMLAWSDDACPGGRRAAGCLISRRASISGRSVGSISARSRRSAIAASALAPLPAEAGRCIAGRGSSDAGRRTAGTPRSRSPAGTCHLFAMKSSRRKACTKRASRARCARTPHDGSPASSPGRPALASASTIVRLVAALSSACLTGAGSDFSDLSLIGKIFVKAAGPASGRDVQLAELAILADRVEGACSSRRRGSPASPAAWTAARVRCGYSTAIMASRAASLACGPSAIASRLRSDFR